jgi:hypothetical protein
MKPHLDSTPMVATVEWVTNPLVITSQPDV